MDCDQGKLFVGGISWETTEDTLKDHFGKYGEVVETVIMRDRNTGSARGFGFVLFSDLSAADKALQDKHVVLGRTVEVKKAVPKGGQHQSHNHHQQHHTHQQHNRGSSSDSSNGSASNNQFRTKKIFVGGLSASLTEEDFKGYFEKFGTIKDVVVMYDSTTHRPRGFGFITFESEEAVENVMQKTFHELNSKVVEVKKAVPKDGSNTSNNSSHSNNNNNNNNNNNYNMRVGAERGSVVGGYQGVIYPPYSPGYRIYPAGYGLSHLSGYASAGLYPYGGSLYGGYPYGGYGGVGFGIATVTPPRSSLNGPAMVNARRSPVLYGNAAAHYPGYVNGGVGGIMGMGTGVGPAANGKWNQGIRGDVTISARRTPPRTDGGKLDDDSSNLTGSHGAIAGRNNSNGSASNNQFRTKKIFVGGLSSSLTEEEFKGYFEKFGTIKDVVVMYDSVTHRPRGFGFITFESEEAVENVTQKTFHQLNSKVVEVKKAVRGTDGRFRPCTVGNSN